MGGIFIYKCPNCHNKDPKYIGYLNSMPYCRKCLKYTKEEYLSYSPSKTNDIQVNLKYPLTSFQKNISEQLVERIEQDKKILVYAVCGAGKTEIIIEVIHKYLKKGEKVGIVIPRRDLVIEIGMKMKNFFKNSKVCLVYGGHNKELIGDIIVLTSHQAFRYKNYFDLLIIDEIDAFPYKGDKVLKELVLKASKGKIISLSATPSQKDLEDNRVFTLFKRYHNHPLPVPKIIKGFNFFLLIFLVKKVKRFLKEEKSVFIYVSSIKEGHKLHHLLKKFFKVIFVYSSMENKEKIMKEVRNKEHRVVISTTILERGVTFANLEVLVYHADEYIFDKATLIQIAGRVGRTIDFPNGYVYFLAKSISKEMQEAIKEIKKYNDM